MSTTLDLSGAAPAQAPELAFTLTRRSVLRGLGMTGLAATVGSFLPQGAAFSAPRSPAPRARSTSGPRVGDGTAAQPTPYVVRASAELSREFFLTDEVKIFDGDQVMPFVNPKNGNQVEALVFAGGSLSHLHRDPTTPTGWTYGAFDLQGVFSSIDNVAVAANASDVFVLIFGEPGDPNDNPAGDPAWLTRLTGPTTWDAGDTIDYDDLGYDSSPNVIKGGISRESQCYFYSTFVDGSTTTLGGWVATGTDYPALVWQQYIQFDTSEAGQVSDSIILYDTGESDPSNPTGFALVLFDNGNLVVYPQDGEVFDTSPMTTAGAVGVTDLIWAWASPTSTTGFPGMAFQQNPAGNLPAGTRFVDENANFYSVADTALAAANPVAVWQQNGLYTVNLLDSDGTLQMVQELSSDGTGSWATPLPLVPDLSAVYGVPTDPTEATLFAVGLDNSLSVLSLGPVGWTQTQVHQVGEELYDLAAYCVQATVLDAVGTAVPGTQVVLGTDRPVGCWTPTGCIAVTPDAPVTLTTDTAGQLSFSIPAQELDCATFSLQARDANGNATGTAITITPDIDVRGFLGGTNALTDQGALTNTSLLGATQTGTSTPVFPGLTTLPSDQQQAAATASVQALGQLVKVGNDAQNTTTTAAAFTLDLSTGTPTYSASTSSVKLGGTRLTFSFGHLFDSIGHAIRHGAMELKTAVVKLADDGKTWLVDLAVKLADDVVNFTDLVITDMKHAFHVIGGFFATLGADIEHAVEWLMHDIVALLDAAKDSAAQIQSWIGDLGSAATTQLNRIKIDTDTWFSAQETTVHDAISELKNIVEGTLGGPPLPPPTTDSSSSTGQSELLKDLGAIGKVMNDAPGMWLLRKFMSYLPATDPGPSIDQTTYEPFLQDLRTDWLDAITFAESLLTFVSTTLTDFGGSNGADPSKISDTKITDWFTDLDGVVHDGLLLLDKVADTVLDLCIAAITLLEDYFTYRYNIVASMGILGLILEECGVDLKFSLDEIISWVVAFPATLIVTIRGYNALFPTTVSAGTARRDRGHRQALQGKDPDGWQVGLGIMGAVTQGVWGFGDMVGDLQQFYDSDSGKRGSASGLIDYIDILCPLVETVALWPSEPNSDGTASYPFHGGIATSTKDVALLPFSIWAALLPSVMGGVAKAGWTDDLDTSGFPSGVQDLVKDYLAPVVQLVSGLVNTVLGSVYSGRNDAGWVAILGTVLGNLSYVFAPAATKWMNETTDDISTLVKMAIDATGNIGAAVCIAEATSLPTP